MIDKQSIAWAETAVRYLDALDTGNLDALAAMWEQAAADPELDSVLTELTDELSIEEGTDSTWESDAASVRTLLREHLPSAFPNEADLPPLTVSVVAARLQADNAHDGRLSASDRTANSRLLGNATTIPEELGLAQFEKWIATLGVSASPHYWRAFQQTAVLLSMGRCQRAGELAAARRAGQPPRGGRP